MLLKQSTAQTVVIGPILDADGVAVTTAVIGNISLAKNGSAAALTTETLTHLANGYYTLALTTTNTNTLGILAAYVNNTSMSMTVFRWNVIVAQVYDSLVSGSDLLQIDIQQLVGSAQDASRILIGSTAQHEVAVTGSNHVAADVHEFQPGVITAGDFASGAITSTVLATDSITSSQIAASAVTEIQSGLASQSSVDSVASNVTTLLSRITSSVATMFSDLIQMIVGSGTVNARWTTKALENGPSGTTTVNVMPLSSTATQRVAGTTITTFLGDRSDITIAVFDSTGTAVNLTTQGTLEVVIERRDGTDLQVIPNASITIGGASSNQATFTPDATAVGTLGQHLWALRRTANEQVLAHGNFVVAVAAFDN